MCNSRPGHGRGMQGPLSKGDKHGQGGVGRRQTRRAGWANTETWTDHAKGAHAKQPVLTIGSFAQTNAVRRDDRSMHELLRHLTRLHTLTELMIIWCILQAPTSIGFFAPASQVRAAPHLAGVGNTVVTVKQHLI